MPRFYRNYKEEIHKGKFSLSGHIRPACVFLAEGDAEAFFFESLLLERDANPDLNVVFCFQGLGNLGPVLHWLTQEQNFPAVTSIGLLLDADTDYVAREQSVIANLQNVQILPNANISPVENIVTVGARRISVFISPGQGRLGAIEEVVLDEVRTKQEWNCIDRFTQCIHDQFGTLPDPKGIVQTFVSLKNSKLCGTGNAFKASILDVAHPAYQALTAVFEPLIA